ncbi:MAG: helix-turn-helix domain-containing protein, partial [Bacillota bacterium]
MCQDNNTTKSRKGKHLNYNERTIIEHLYNIQDKSPAEIGDELDRHRTTIKREIDKGTVELRNTDYSIREEYVAAKGQEKYDNNATAKGPKIKLAKEHKLANFIKEKIEKKKEFDLKIHWSTIY